MRDPSSEKARGEDVWPVVDYADIEAGTVRTLIEPPQANASLGDQIVTLRSDRDPAIDPKVPEPTGSA